MMDLLDLPPEIFQKIIASYVHKVGVSEAWERREVCSEYYLMNSRHKLIGSRNIRRLLVCTVLRQTAYDQVRGPGSQTITLPARRAVLFVPMQKLVRSSETPTQSRSQRR